MTKTAADRVAARIEYLNLNTDIPSGTWDTAVWHGVISNDADAVPSDFISVVDETGMLLAPCGPVSCQSSVLQAIVMASALQMYAALQEIRDTCHGEAHALAIAGLEKPHRMIEDAITQGNNRRAADLSAAIAATEAARADEGYALAV